MKIERIFCFVFFLEQNITPKKNSTQSKTPKKTGSVVASPKSNQKIDLWQEAKSSAEVNAFLHGITCFLKH